MILKLNDVYRQYEPDVVVKRFNNQELLNIHPLAYLAHQLNDNNKLEPITDNCEYGTSFHMNYLYYLDKCYSNHIGIVISPDIIWYSILCEIAMIVNKNPDKYRKLFTNSEEKQEISVLKGDDLPLEDFVNSLRTKVNVNTDLFVMNFSTTNQNSQMAQFAAFCDMCSPFYNYSVYCCGFPHIKILGNVDDYQKIVDSLKEIHKFFDNDYILQAIDVVTDIVNNINNEEFFKKMFYTEKCGSGSQTEIYGWITNLFNKKPNLLMTCNFPTHVSKVEYKDLDTNEIFTIKVGLLYSNFDDVNGVLVPEFGYILYKNK